MGKAVALSVRCLGCGQVYLRPMDRSATGAHDCPACGYVGWIPAARSFNPEAEPSRFAVDPLHRQIWR